MAWTSFGYFSLYPDLDIDLRGLWTQDLKDFARQSNLDVVYSETGRDSNGRGYVFITPGQSENES